VSKYHRVKSLSGIKLNLEFSPLIQSWNSKESPGQKSELRLVQSVVPRSAVMSALME
jgi:hypothetical protein